MFFKARKLLILLPALLLSGLANATPLDIDFRDGGTWGGNGLPTYPTSVDPDIWVDANGGNLYWDSTDGYGIQGGEWDEIDTEEVLTVWFEENYFTDNNVLLTGVLLTDLFPANDGGAMGESAIVQLFNSDGVLLAEFILFATIDDPNGEQYIDFGAGFDVAYVVFTTTAGHEGSEFSVAGFNTTVSVPEPGTLVLLGTGLLFMAWRRKRQVPIPGLRDA